MKQEQKLNHRVRSQWKPDWHIPKSKAAIAAHLKTKKNFLFLWFSFTTHHKILLQYEYYQIRQENAFQVANETLW